jgi:hypothetical protein
LIGGIALAGILGVASMLHGQAIPTASRIGSLQAGAGWFLANPDFAQSHIQGLVLYSDLDFAPRLGIEGEIHYTAIAPSDITENLYVAGPRYIIRRKRVNGYAKVLFGAGHFGLQSGSNPLPQTNTYFTYAAGGGIDIHATSRINVRAIDFEIQKWPGFPPNGLTPFSGYAGVAYVFH